MFIVGIVLDCSQTTRRGHEKAGDDAKGKKGFEWDRLRLKNQVQMSDINAKTMLNDAMSLPFAKVVLPWVAKCIK